MCREILTTTATVASLVASMMCIFFPGFSFQCCKICKSFWSTDFYFKLLTDIFKVSTSLPLSAVSNSCPNLCNIFRVTNEKPSRKRYSLLKSLSRFNLLFHRIITSSPLPAALEFHIILCSQGVPIFSSDTAGQST